MSGRSFTRGFTLIELMITIALLAIVVTIAVPNFTAFIQKTQLQGQTDDLLTFLQYARSEAVTRRTTAIVEVNDAAPWEVQVGGQSVRELSHDGPVKLDADVATITYNANGTATPALIIVCRDDNHETAFVVQVRASGASIRHARGKDAAGDALTKCTL
ncbi:GspH/FimT family pseudopilin [Pseudomonas stutzeri]|nr:GspH/FimT family pseudopilin [Stutzerimonas degradans]